MQRRDFCTTTLSGAALAIPATVTTGSGVTLKPHSPTGHSYAQACEVINASRWLYISGQVPADKDDKVPSEFADQYRLAWANVESLLRSAGMSFDNLVKVTIFLASRDLIAKSAGLRRAVIGERSPAITIVIAGIFDAAWLLEIEAVAAA